MEKSGFCSNLILCGYLYFARRQVMMSFALAKSAYIFALQVAVRRELFSY